MSINKRLIVALSVYAALIALSFVFLHDIFLKAILILLVGLAAKTLIAWKAGW
jgi:hypothetical protein